MVVRVLVGRAKLFQTRAVTGWEDGEEDGRVLTITDPQLP